MSSRRIWRFRWRGVLVAAAVLAGGLMVVPSVQADIVGNATNGGFKNGNGWTALMHGVGNPPTITGSAAQVTDDTSNEHNTVFYNTPQYVGAFTATFTFQVSGTKLADGASFCIHNDPAGPMAGTNQNGGSALGYQGIDNSVAVAFNVYSKSNPLVGSPGHAGETDVLWLNNALGSAQIPGGTYANDPSTSGVDITSGNPIQVTLTYDGTTLTQALTDTTTGSTVSYTYTIDIPLTVGSKDNTVALVPGTAFVGFTGGTGGSHAIQTFSNFTFFEYGP